MLNIQVVNQKHSSTAFGFYIGRPSILGNPFIIGRDGTREDVIEKYRIYLERELSIKDSPVQRTLRVLYKKAVAGEQIRLVCYCAPRACHGDVIAGKLQEWASAGKSPENI
jgi:hypothetical protein